MKQMKYKTKREIEILDKGMLNGFDYYIISYGTHPCAYIVLDDEHPAYKVNYNILNEYYKYICNGGFTYSENKLLDIIDEKLNKWVIGWDYAHFNDFCGTFLEDPHLANFKKWTTEEIKKEVKKVTYELYDSQNSNTGGNHIKGFLQGFKKGYEYGQIGLDIDL